MALYPAQLTPEEKNLKKRYAKLLEKVPETVVLLKFHATLGSH